MQLTQCQLRELIQTPSSFLQRHHISLRLWAEPLCLSTKQIFGSWDPLLREIGLYQLRDRSAEQVVNTLLHETFHALTGVRDEDVIDTLVGEALQSLSEHEIQTCAAHLRQLAPPSSPRTDTSRAKYQDSVISIGVFA